MTSLSTPKQISVEELRASGSLSPSMYRRVEIPARITRPIRDLIDGYDKGSDPGSLQYLRESTHYFIRTKALQAHSWLLYPKGGAITPVNPRAFVDLKLSDGDILLSKDSNIGECAMVDGDGWNRHMLSGGVVRLRPNIDPHYLFAFLKHSLFKTQLVSMVPRGSTIAHANELWLDCEIPFPDQLDAEDVISYVRALTEAIIDKEKAIRARAAEIALIIDRELTLNQGEEHFKYEHPSSLSIRNIGRLDTGLYCRGFQSLAFRVQQYAFGQTTLSEMGVRSRRGHNLAVSILGMSLYATEYKPGWYELIRPVNITEYGTLETREWLGTPKSLQTLSQGDLILGCEGFEKGRSMVLIDAPERCVTNFHGTILSVPDAPLWRTIFVRCFLSYLRDRGVIDWVGVGGSGGHMSPEYFDYLPIPKFPDAVQQIIARLYHYPARAPAIPQALANFVNWHRSWNAELGIWELDREMKTLKAQLEAIQDDIIEGRTVSLPIPRDVTLS